MKAIFNSLGSNYNFNFAAYALGLLFSRKSGDNKLAELHKKLEEIFKGKAFSFYKGRHAIEFSLRAMGVGKGDEVLTQAFTCFAVEEGIKRSGAEPVFADIEEGNINLSVKTLKDAYGNNGSVKAVLVQHTLGFPADIHAIRKWCDEKDLLLIEDLAHSYGARDKSGEPVGTLADIVILSFGRDKIFDAISGGACVLKPRVQRAKLNNIKVENNVSFKTVFSDLTYPVLTWFIRKTYFIGYIGVGKIIHFIFKSLGLLTTSLESREMKLTKLPEQHASLVLHQLSRINEQIKHRKNIVKLYLSSFSNLDNFKNLNYKYSTNLRFPLTVEDPRSFTNCTKLSGIYLADRWYKSSVDCGSSSNVSSYKKDSCPNAENLSQHIINLPTHINVSKNEAQKIINLVKPCLKQK